MPLAAKPAHECASGGQAHRGHAAVALEYKPQARGSRHTAPSASAWDSSAWRLQAETLAVLGRSEQERALGQLALKYGLATEYSLAAEGEPVTAKPMRRQ